MKIKNLFLICLLIFSINVGYASNSFFFKDIEFNGLNKVSKAEALSYLTFHENDFISINEIKNSIKNLILSKKFEEVKICRLKTKIIFKVKEYPFISKINIFGNVSLDLSYIQNILDSCEISENNFLNKKKLISLKEKILYYYVSILKDGTIVNFNIIKKKNNIKNLNIEILEGNDLNIKELKIIGNKKFSSQQIMSYLNYYKKYSFFKKIIKSKYNYQYLQEDLKNLYYFYNSKGYINFIIKNTKLNYSNDKKNVSIIIDVHEGHPYCISEISIDENDPYIFKNSKILSQIKLNQIYNVDDVISLKNNIMVELFKNGYLSSSVEIKPLIDKVNKKIKLIFDINKNKQFYLNKILFSGNNLTKKKYLIRKMHQKEHSVINNDFLTQDLEDLKETNFFSDINLEFQPVFNKKFNVVNLIYHVKEKKSNVFNFGLGYDNLNKLNFNLSFIKYHLFRTGNLLSFYFSKSFYKNLFKIFYTNPYFSNKNFILTENLFGDIFGKDLDFYKNNKDIFKIQSIKNIYSSIKNMKFLNHSYFKNNKFNYGLDISLGVPFLNNNFYNLSIGYDHYEFIKNLKNSSTNKIILQNNLSNFLNQDNYLFVINNFNINNSIHLNTIKNYNFFPLSGIDTNISLKIFFPIQQKNYFKFIFDTKQYYPIKYTNNNIIFLFRSYFGFECFKENSLYYKNYDNFHAENDYTIRGYSYDSIGSKLILINKENDINNFKNTNEIKKNKNYFIKNNIGGNFISITNLELISSIPFIKNEYLKNFKLSTFLDFGSIWIKNFFFNTSHSTFMYLNPNKIYSSYGFSLKWNSPFGLFSLSYSFPINSKNTDNIKKFQIFFGR
ncbi:outer membrane protein assembly factor BamA [Buchnera aphidicola (Periphyllus koelreuteriae)]|uniref:outer membrane protein assembly factor BamA n=1 Tax=Buchnera aphidicola TaxID=9 RepID=UPI0031B86F0B